MAKDKETTEQLHKGQAIKEMTRSEGWKYVQAMLTEKLLDYQSVNNIEVEAVQDLALEVGIRKGVVEKITEWFTEVGAELEQHNDNSTLIEDNHIVREED